MLVVRKQCLTFIQVCFLDLYAFENKILPVLEKPYITFWRTWQWLWLSW